MLAAIIIGTVALVFLVDLWGSAEVLTCALFILPLTLCAIQDSKRMLWVIAAVVSVLTIVAELWGFNRNPLSDPLVVSVNHTFLIASLLTLTTFIHFSISHKLEIALDSNRTERKRREAFSQNKRLEVMIASATRDMAVLAQMEERYRGLLEAAPDGIVVVNEGGKIVLLNVRAETLFGYRRDELVGKLVSEIIPNGFAERLIADGTRTSAEAHDQQIGEGLELVGFRRDGSTFPMEIMLSSLDSTDGILVTAAIRDITERKLGESALRQSEERFRMLVSNATDYAIVILDPDGQIVSWNAGAEQMKGFRPEEIVGSHFSRFYPPEAVEIGLPARDLQNAATNERFESEGWRMRKDGSRFFANIVITALRDDGGGLRGFGKITRDVTERRDAEGLLLKSMGELRRSNEELLQFANVASHDLQEPLRMVASFTQLLAKRYAGRLDSDADEFISFAVDGCRRMQALIADLLTYSRVGSEALPLRTVSGEASFNEALDNLKVMIDESGAVVTHDPLPSIMMDGSQLTSVLQNLIGNAVKYRREESPRVHIAAARAKSNEWIFSVKDNGLGIRPEYFDKIFVLFQRLHGRDEFEGTGMGLAICKKLVVRWGGRIWVDSTINCGSTFNFSVPDLAVKYESV